MKRVVILTGTAAEAKWAIRYKQTHREQNAIILSPTFESQQQLSLAGEAEYSYFHNPVWTRDVYQSSLQKWAEGASKVYKTLHPYLNNIYIQSSSLIDLSRVSLEMEFTKILFEDAYLRSVENNLRPSQYFISAETKPENIGMSPRYFHLAVMCRYYFLQKSKVTLFKANSSVAPRTIKNSLEKILPLQLLRTFTYRLINLLFYAKQALTIRTIPTNNDVLLFSAGLNLLYYTHTIKFLSSKITGVVISGDQLTEEEYLLNLSGISYYPLKLFKSADISERIQVLESSLRKSVNKAIVRIKKFNPLKVVVSERVAKATYATLEIVFKQSIKKYVTQVLLAENAIKRTNPSLILTTHDPAPSALPFVFAGKARKKKTAVLLHGWNDIILGEDYYSQNMIAWGTYTVNWFHTVLNKRKNDIYLAGFPFLDISLGNYKFKKTEELKEKEIVFGLLLTLYPPNTHPQSMFLDQLFDAAAKNDFNGEFWVRVHAGQTVTEITCMAKKHKVRIRFNPYKNLNDFINYSDVVLAWDTTAIFWPMVMGKPLFYTSPMWGDGITPVKKYKAAWMPKKADDVFMQLRKIQKNQQLIRLMQQGQARFLKDIVGFTKFDGSERTARNILKILNLPI